MCIRDQNEPLGGIAIYGMARSTWKRNFISIENGFRDGLNTFMCRNFLNNWTQVRDTVLNTGPNLSYYSWYHAGQDTTGSLFNLTMDSSFVYNENGDAITLKASPKNLRLRYTTLVGSREALSNASELLVIDSVVVTHL